MFGIGFSEIFLVVMIVILVTKPEDLPKFIKRVKHLYNKLVRMYRKCVEEVDNLSNL